MRTLLCTSLAVAAALSLTACTGGGDDATTSASASVSAAQKAAAAKTTEADGSFGARKELAKESCTADKNGAWSFTGTLTNSQKTAQSYVVTASVVDGKTFTVLGRKEFTNKLDAGKSVPLKAEKFFTKKVDGAQCVLRVTRKAA